MKLQATNHLENDTLIACTIHAIANAKSCDIDLTFANGYTVSIIALNHATVDVVISRKHEVLNLDAELPRDWNASEMTALLSNISRAKTDFDCGFAYARYLARTGK